MADEQPTTWNEMLKVGNAEHKRALARARQQRKRLRDSHGTSRDVTPEGITVTKRLQGVAKEILNGDSQATALVKHGFAHSSVKVAEDAKALIVQEMQALGISRKMVYESIVRRDKATKTVPSGETYIESPDWQAQSAACRDAITLLDRVGELPQPQQSQASSSITVNILNYHAPQDVVSDTCEELIITSDQSKSLDSLPVSK